MSKKLKKMNSMLLIIDVQEKLVNMLEKRTCAEKTKILAETARLLNIPVIVTEQYPKGLGETISEIKFSLDHSTEFYEKITFSALDNDDVKHSLDNSPKKQIIICGIEAHVCVLQTAIDLLSLGYEVYVVEDACASRNKYEFKLAMNRLKEAGAVITCTEMVIFELLETSKHPKFKELQALIK